MRALSVGMGKSRAEKRNDREWIWQGIASFSFLWMSKVEIFLFLPLDHKFCKKNFFSASLTIVFSA